MVVQRSVQWMEGSSWDWQENSCFALILRKCSSGDARDVSIKEKEVPQQEVAELLGDLQDVSKNIPEELPTVQSIGHHIDQIPEANLPNKAHVQYLSWHQRKTENGRCALIQELSTKSQ